MSYYSSYYSSTLCNGKCTILETQDILPVHPDEIAAYLKYDYNYNINDLIYPIIRATEILEASNCYALIPKRLKFTHHNPHILLPLGPASDVTVHKQYKRNNPQQLDPAHFEQDVYSNSYNIKVLQTGLTEQERQACGISPTNANNYYKSSHMSFIVEYWAGRCDPSAVEKWDKVSAQLPGEQVREYRVRKDLSGAFLHRLCTLIKQIDTQDQAELAVPSPASRASVIQVSRRGLKLGR
jgi:hypothetical protein